jgi:tRNA A37 threonylcarbamoyladenosine dehydratase
MTPKTTSTLGIFAGSPSTLVPITSFVVGASAAAIVRWLWDRSERRRHSPRNRRNDVNNFDPQSITTEWRSTTTTTTTTSIVPEELQEEMLSRHTLYFGTEGMDAIRAAKVCIVGLGGVGSHTAVMLARGGVQKYIRLIDFDQCTLSSLNRHACATLKDVGTPKVVCVKKFCMDMGMSSHSVDARVEMYTTESAQTLLTFSGTEEDQDQTSSWDIVIDCIDDVPTKAALLAYCILNKIRVLSCMGAGGKSDMTRLHVSDLRTAAKDPLATKLRQTLRKTMKEQQEAIPGAVADESYLDDMDQLTIIYSSEKTIAKLADLTEEQKSQSDKSQFGNVDNMRIRVIPVLGPLPAIMGQSLASIALCELGKKPIHQPVTGERVSRSVRNKIHQQLTSREHKIETGKLELESGAQYIGPIEIDNDEVDYLMGVWRNRCAVTNAKLGTVLSLARWDTSRPATIDNLVLMSVRALKAYDEKGKASIPPGVQRRIEDRLAACRDLSSDL